MSLVARPAITATAVVRMVAMPSAVAAAGANAIAVRAYPGCGKNHSSNDKGNHAGEHQQENSEIHPTGLGHPISPLFPRLGRRFDSTVRM